MTATVDVDEKKLLERLRAGDEAALESLVRKYYGGLMSFLSHLLGSSDAAEDVLQVLWLRLWERRESLDIHGSLRVYLFRGAKNLAIDTLRREKLEQRIGHQLVNAETVSHHTDDVATIFERDELALAIADAINALPARCREVFILSRDGGMSYKEIAETLGVSVNTVNTQITRAGAAIRRAVLPFLVILLSFV
jgi:RNA polymerase sigma-70 factor (ECF subfamily)